MYNMYSNWSISMGFRSVCVSKLTPIASDNGLVPGRCQATLSTNAGILLIGPLGTNFTNYGLRLSGIFKTSTVHTCIAERRIRFMLSQIINDADPSVKEKVNTYSFQGFTKYVKMTKFHTYATHCLITNCYICQNS